MKNYGKNCKFIYYGIISEKYRKIRKRKNQISKISRKKNR